MTLKEARKTCLGFLLVVMAAIISMGCGDAGSIGSFVGSANYDVYLPPEIVGRIETEEIKESSGLSASECQDVLWTHNDAGNDALIFGMDLQGRHLGTWKLQNATNTDWESIATFKHADGKCSLIIGDIGDNDEKRSEVVLYRIPEPSVSGDSRAASANGPLATAPVEILTFTYADGAKNAETLLVHPQTGDIYVLTKSKRGPSGIHKLKPAFGPGVVARTEKIAELSVPSDPSGLLTGGSFSPDGKRLMLCDKANGYEFVLPDGGAPDAIWAQKPQVVDLGQRKQGEGVSYGRDGYSLYASSEKKNSPLIRIVRKQ